MPINYKKPRRGLIGLVAGALLGLSCSISDYIELKPLTAQRVEVYSPSPIIKSKKIINIEESAKQAQIELDKNISELMEEQVQVESGQYQKGEDIDLTKQPIGVEEAAQQAHNELDQYVEDLSEEQLEREVEEHKRVIFGKRPIEQPEQLEEKIEEPLEKNEVLDEKQTIGYILFTAGSGGPNRSMGKIAIDSLGIEGGFLINSKYFIGVSAARIFENPEWEKDPSYFWDDEMGVSLSLGMKYEDNAAHFITLGHHNSMVESNEPDGDYLDKRDFFNFSFGFRCNIKNFISSLEICNRRGLVFGVGYNF